MSITGLTGVFGFHRQVGAGHIVRGPYNAGTGATSKEDTKQALIVTNGSTSDHTYRLMYRGEITAPIVWNATQGAILSALQALSGIGAGNSGITVTGSNGQYVIAFSGAFNDQPVGVEVYDHKMPTVNGVPGSVVIHSSGTVTVGGSSVTCVTGGEWAWVPATQVNFQPNQIVQSIPMEVGGDLWARGSYKGGVSGQGQVMFIPRGGLGLAELFYAFTGAVPKSGTSTEYGNKSATKYTASDSITYRFLPQSGTAAELPWYTLIRNVGGKFVEEFGDARLGNFAFDMAASNLLTVDASFVSKNCGTLPVTFGGTGGARVGDQKAGNGIVFQSVDAKVKLDTNVNGVPGPLVENQNLNPTRLNIAFANELSSNEFVVGSYYLQDITNLSRTANVTYSVYLKDPDLYARTYSYGADIANAQAAWSPKVWKGGLELTMTGGPIMNGQSSTGKVYSIKVTIPEMDYMATPISLAGNNLVEYQLTTNVVLSQKADETSLANRVYPFEIEYVTDLTEDVI